MSMQGNPVTRAAQRVETADCVLQQRRDFLGKAILMVLPVVLLGSTGSVSSAPTTTTVPPARIRGSTRIDVRDTGARGDGSRDDTAAFQSAIDSLPADGGTVYVPAGTYMIDATRKVRLRSHMHLQLAAGAKLMAKRNAADRAYVLMVYKVSDVEISGGRIVGDRDRHLGTTGEWGHGIMIRGSSRVTVRDIHISKCWGDGISIGGAMVKDHDHPAVPSNDVVIAKVVCSGNRRQGLTIGRSRNVRVHDSEFSATSGVLPGCGIDIEPDAGGMAQGVHIENCLVRANRGSGIQAYKRVSDVTIKRCVIEHNGGYGVLAIGASGGLIVDNRIQGNALKGVELRKGTSNYQLSRNTVSNNSTRFRRAAAGEA